MARLASLFRSNRAFALAAWLLFGVSMVLPTARVWGHYVFGYSCALYFYWCYPSNALLLALPLWVWLSPKMHRRGRIALAIASSLSTLFLVFLTIVGKLWELTLGCPGMYLWLLAHCLSTLWLWMAVKRPRNAPHIPGFEVILTPIPAEQ